MKNKKISFLIAVSLILIVLSSIPYFFGLINCPGDGVFTGYTKNIDDMAVYGSWVKQCSEGFFIRNLFQENPNGGLQVNVYFNVLGLFSKICHTSPALTLHIFRIIQGIVLVFVFWLFTGLWTDKNPIRKISLLVFLFGSGFGAFFKSTTTIDVWQPEAITFMSVYLNPLFTIGLILIISILYNLIKLEREGNNKYFIFALIYLLILGNVHTYDIVNIYVLWSLYLIYRLISCKNFILWIKSSYKEILVLLFGLISPIINYNIYINDIIYRSRVNTEIKTHPIWDILLGYGFVFIFAIVGIVFIKKFESIKKYFPVLIWFIIGLLTIYIPFSQQRKFIMGYEIPLAILCGFGIYYALKNFNLKLYFALLLILMFGTNLSVMVTDINKLKEFSTQTQYLAYLSKDELDVLNKLNSLDFDEPIFAPPQIALFIPEYSGKRVYYGHWSETPDFQKKLKEYVNFTKNGVTNQKNLIIYEKNEIKLEKNFKLLYNNSSYILYKNR